MTLRIRLTASRTLERSTTKRCRFCLHHGSEWSPKLWKSRSTITVLRLPLHKSSSNWLRTRRRRLHIPRGQRSHPAAQLASLSLHTALPPPLRTPGVYRHRDGWKGLSLSDFVCTLMDRHPFCHVLLMFITSTSCYDMYVGSCNLQHAWSGGDASQCIGRLVHVGICTEQKLHLQTGRRPRSSHPSLRPQSMEPGRDNHRTSPNVHTHLHQFQTIVVHMERRP